MVQDGEKDVAVFWDLESCSLPRNGNIGGIVQRIRAAASQYGRVTHITAYLAHEMQSSEQAAKRDREGGLSWSRLPSFNVNLEYCCRFGQTEVVDRRIITDVPYYLRAHPATKVIVLITDDGDFINLGERLKKYKKRVVVISNRQSFERYRRLFDDVYHWKRDIIVQAGLPWASPSTPSTISSYVPWSVTAGNVEADEGGIEGWTNVTDHFTGNDTEDAVTYPIVQSSDECSSGSDSGSSDIYMDPLGRWESQRRRSSCGKSQLKGEARRNFGAEVSSGTVPSDGTKSYHQGLGNKLVHAIDTRSDVGLAVKKGAGLDLNATIAALRICLNEDGLKASSRVTLGPGHETKTDSADNETSDSDSDWLDELEVARIVQSTSGYNSVCSSESGRQLDETMLDNGVEVSINGHADVGVDMALDERTLNEVLPLEPTSHVESSTVSKIGDFRPLHHVPCTPPTTIPSSSGAKEARGIFSLGRMASFLQRRATDPEDSCEEWGSMNTTNKWKWNCFGNLGVSLGSKRKASETLEVDHTATPVHISKKARVAVLRH